MREHQPPKLHAGGRADARGSRRPALLSSAAALMLAACGGGGGTGGDAGSSAAEAGPAQAPAAAAPAAGGTAAGGTAAGGTAAGTQAAAGGVGRTVNPTSLNPGGSLRRDTTGAPYDATAADSVERGVAAGATGETDPALTGGNSGMELPSNVPVSQVGAGPTVTQRDAGGDRYRGGRYGAASAFIGRDGRAYYTDAAGRILTDAEVRGRLSRSAPLGDAAAASPSGAAIATGSVAAYQPNAPDSPGAPARNGSPATTEPGTQSGIQTALSPAGAVDRNVAWGGASPEVAAKLARGTAVAPVPPGIGDSARPASPGGPVNPAVPNAVLAPTAPNARAVLTLINSSEIEAGRLAEERASTPALRRFATTIRREHEAQLNRLEQIAGQPALTQAQRNAVGRALAEQRSTLVNLQGGNPNFDTQWISAQAASHEKSLNDLRALGREVPTGPLAAYVAQLTTRVQAHLNEATRLQSRPGSSAPAPRSR
jgi:predicted outer membrane protein